MPSYGYASRKREENFFASIRTNSGGSAWEHVRTNLGRRVAYAMIAKHWAGEGRIEHFRDDHTATAYDREGIEQGSDGILRTNPYAGYSTFYERQAGA